MQSVLDITPVGRLGDPMEIGGERPLPGLAGGRLRDRARARRQRRHGDVSRSQATRETEVAMEPRSCEHRAPSCSAASARRAAAALAPHAEHPARRRGGAARRASAPRPTTSCSSEGTLKLLRYRRETPATHAEPVLFCYALINRPYILDLQPDKSVVAAVPGAGLRRLHDRLGRPLGRRPRPDARGLRLRLPEGRRRRSSCASTSASDLHLLGYCMGGTMSALFAALHPEPVKTLTLLAAPDRLRRPGVAAESVDGPPSTSTSTRSSTPTATARRGFCSRASCS